MIDEIIGKKVKVVKGSAPEYMGLEGIAIDETKNTIHVEINGSVKIIPKKGNVFDISGNIINGNEILYDPVKRVKKLWRKTRR